MQAKRAKALADEQKLREQQQEKAHKEKQKKQFLARLEAKQQEEARVVAKVNTYMWSYKFLPYIGPSRSLLCCCACVYVI